MGRGDTGQRGSLAREVRAVDPNVPVYAVRTMEDVIGRALSAGFT